MIWRVKALSAAKFSLVGGLLLFTLTFAACAPSVQQISSRSPNLFDKEAGSLAIHGRRPEDGQKSPEIFVRRREAVVKPLDMPNDTGSLFNADDERNYLFPSSGPVRIGRFVTIAVSSNKLSPPKDGKTPAGSADKSTVADTDKGAAGGDAFEQDLIKSLPSLEPANKDDVKLLKHFKMRIMHRYDNGDALVQFTRESQGENQANQTTVQARIPYERLVAGEDLTTDDLFDVKFAESRDGEVVDRRSSAWEDEYTVRLGDFSEAKSRVAMELDDKRKQMMEARAGLEARIKTLANERQQVAKQREEWLKKQGDSESKIHDLESKVKDQDSTIQDQKAEIQKLNPEDKPGDAKDVKNGK